MNTSAGHGLTNRNVEKCLQRYSYTIPSFPTEIFVFLFMLSPLDVCTVQWAKTLCFHTTKYSTFILLIPNYFKGG